MPTMNIDEQTAATFEPIIFILDGKEYTIEKIETTTLDKMRNASDSSDSIAELIAELAGVDKKEFKHTDVRKLIYAMQFVNKVMAEQTKEFSSKNVLGESVK